MMVMINKLKKVSPFVL